MSLWSMPFWGISPLPVSSWFSDYPQPARMPNDSKPERAPGNGEPAETTEAVAPLPGMMGRHGKDPEAPAPASADELSHEFGHLAGDLLQAAGILEVLAGRTSRESFCSYLWVLQELTDRARTRLDEASGPLGIGQTKNMAEWIEDVGTMALRAKGALRLARDIEEAGETTEMRDEAFAVAFDAITYVQERLDFLLYESDLSYLEE